MTPICWWRSTTARVLITPSAATPTRSPTTASPGRLRIADHTSAADE
jgi:hypothetical protein